MNREEIKNAIEVMQAYVDGKAVQYRSRCGGEEWYLVNGDAGWDWECFEFRVKPEEEYRPFRSAEEAWDEMGSHYPFGWVKNKAIDGCYEHISYLDGVMCVIGAGSISGQTCQKYEKYFEQYTFVDGVPFGVKKEENHGEV